MYVHLKQSGELLDAQGGSGDLWTPNGVRVSTEKIVDTYKKRDSLGVGGMLVVSGAGNIVRGDRLKKSGIALGREDFLGRLATVQNTVVLATALEERRVPVSVFVADTMRLSDIATQDGFLDPYDIEAVADAYNRERVVLVAGGTGEDGKTTDNAVLEYARRQREHTPEEKVLVLKGTKHDGIFDKDPQEHLDAQRYARISAGAMLSEYERFCAVDRSALEMIQDTGLEMRVYADGQHDLPSAIVANGSGNAVGTLIVSGDKAPELVA